ncbi:MAG: hypothetical protein HY739_12985 [Desulfobacterales bacterium]|nr:hypothetical protein [Desulfobacterales bacterium]
MNTERQILKQEHLALKQKKRELAVKAGGKIDSIKNLLARASLSPISEIDMEVVADLSIEARDLRREYMDVCDKIAQVEKELE